MKKEIILDTPENQTLQILPEIACPKCGWKCRKGEGYNVSFSDKKIDGDYCLKCWAKKQIKGLPKMNLIKDN